MLRGLLASSSGGSSTLTINSTPVSGATAGQLLISDGSKLQVGGAANAASLALGGATIGSNALAVTGTASISGTINSQHTLNSNGAFNLGNGNLIGDASGNITIYESLAVSTSSANPYIKIYDTYLYRDAANILAQVNGTNANTFRVYNTSSSSNANYERGVFDWTTTANVLTIGTQNAGTGVARNIQFVVGGVNKLDYGISNTNSWTFAGAVTSASLALGGATIGSNALAVTGTTQLGATLNAAAAGTNIVNGFSTSSYPINSGSAVTSGTVTLNSANGNAQHYTNGGAHTLAPQSGIGGIYLEITNNGSAGAITTSGYTKTIGSFNTTNSAVFQCVSIVTNSKSCLYITEVV